MENKFFIRYVLCKYFLPICGLYFHYLNSVSHRAHSFNFHKVEFQSFFYFTDCTFDVIPKNSQPSLRSCCFSPKFSLRSFMVLHFTFKSMIHFEIIFVKM